MAFSFHYVTPAGAGAKDGAAWASAMSWTELLADFPTAAAGDIYIVEEGTYTMTADLVTATDGNAVDPIAIIGVTTATRTGNVTGDAINQTYFGTGANRPLFDAGANAYGITIDDYGRIENIRIETRDTYPIHLDTAGVVRNCKVTQNYTGGTTSYGIFCDGTVINCEVTGTECNNGIAGASAAGFVFNYVHDITEAGSSGITPSTFTGAILFNVLDAVPIGINKTTDPQGVIFGNTFYDCDVGLSATTDIACAVINNIFSESDVDAIIWSTPSTAANVFMYNHFYNNLDDHDGIVENGDANDLFSDFWAVLSGAASDPAFTAAGSDFSLQAGSPCIDTGMSMLLGVG
jgi:hypothetical protein